MTGVAPYVHGDFLWEIIVLNTPFVTGKRPVQPRSIAMSQRTSRYIYQEGKRRLESSSTGGSETMDAIAGVEQILNQAEPTDLGSFPFPYDNSLIWFSMKPTAQMLQA